VRTLPSGFVSSACCLLPFALFTAAVGLGCDAPAVRVDSSTKAAADTIVWRSVGTWSGRGNRQTESFDVTTGALRLRWETRDAATPGTASSPAGEGRFRVSLYSSISGRPLQIVVDRSGPGADTAYVEDDPRVSYLVIESDQLEWTATLEEAVGSTAGAPRKGEPSPP
jgi:hypothetical protein